MPDRDYSIKPATLEDALSMAHRMREIDVQEIWASHRIRPLPALVHLVRTSEVAKTGREGEDIVLMFGMIRQNLLGSAGTVWMLATDLLDLHSFRFLRECGTGIVAISAEFTIIENYCDARNSITVRWLKWLGFTVEEAEPYGVYNMPFHHFYKEVA